jgi:hypothetical protein
LLLLLLLATASPAALPALLLLLGTAVGVRAHTHTRAEAEAEADARRSFLVYCGTPGLWSCWSSARSTYYSALCLLRGLKGREAEESFVSAALLARMNEKVRGKGMMSKNILPAPKASAGVASCCGRLFGACFVCLRNKVITSK